jgi:hypothetical protein
MPFYALSVVGTGIREHDGCARISYRLPVSGKTAIQTIDDLI